MAGYRIVAGQDPDLAQLLGAAAGGGMGQGWGPTQIIGADGGPQPNTQQVMDRVMAQQAYLAEQMPLDKARKLVLGFDSGADVASGATVDIIAQPQVLFRPQRLVVPSDIAGQFVIEDIRVGKNSMFVSAGGVPARMFDEQGVGVEMTMDTAQISQQVVLTVTNTGGAGARFRAGLAGASLET